jgi:uncharacterized protein YjhX (UPF0386 family)
MDKNNNESSKRRVSFAPEPQVMYIYPEEQQSSKTTETNEDEISVELTADYSKYIGLNLLEQGRDDDANFLDMDLNHLLKKSNSSTTHDTPTQIDTGKEQSLSERIQVEVPETAVSPGGNKESVVEKRKTGRASPRRRRSSPRKTDPRDGTLQENLNNSAISSDTVNVEEIINTQDLKKIIPQVRKESPSITELLVSKGIRFLDSLVVSNTRRDTMSKSVNAVPPSQVQYYEKYVEPRTLFFQEFSGALERRMQEQEAVNSELEGNLSVAGTILEREDAGNQLRALKAECRMRAKIDWYELRKKKELEYNQLIIDKKNELVSEYNSLMLRNQEMEERLREKREKNSAMEGDVSGMRSRVGLEADDSMSKLNKAEGIPSKIEHMRRAVAEQEAVADSLHKEIQDLEYEKRSKEAEERMLRESLDRTMDEINRLEETYKSRSVTEEQLKETRQDFKTMSAIFNFELLRIEPCFIRFKIMRYLFSISLDASLQIAACEVKTAEPTEDHPLYVYGCTLFDVNGASLLRGMERIVLTCAVVSSLHKELDILGTRHEVECYAKDGQLHIEILVVNVEKCIKDRVLVVLRNGHELEITRGGVTECHSIYDHIGLVSRSINARQE